MGVQGRVETHGTACTAEENRAAVAVGGMDSFVTLFARQAPGFG